MSKAKAREEARLRNKGPAAEPARCENCGKPAVRLTEDGINLCRECYALCPEDTQNAGDEARRQTNQLS